MKINSIYLVAIVFVLFVLGSILFKSCNKEEHLKAYKDVKIEQVRKNIEQEKEVIRVNKKTINKLDSSDYKFTMKLDSFKIKHDTLNIIKTQDTLIGVLRLKESELKLNEVVYDKIIKNQDTLIEVQEKDIKKFRRQRNIGIATVSLGAILLIILSN